MKENTVRNAAFWKELSGAPLREQMLAFSVYGAGPGGGISRTFGSKAYFEAAEAMLAFMKACGLVSYMDPVGNLHGLYTPADLGEDAEEILFGSHLDTVKDGGLFDGLLGIIAAIRCAKQAMDERAPLGCRLHVVVTNGEEGNDLGGTFGSRCMAGGFDTADAGLMAKAARYGITREAVEESAADFSRVRCWLELHIEQGKTLARENREVAVVEGIVGLSRYYVDIRGQSNHAGTTRMEDREDALVRAAKFIVRADGLARELGGMVATASRVEVTPNALAVINGHVRMVLECRSLSAEKMERFVSRLRAEFADVADLSEMVKKRPVFASGAVMAAMEEACREGGISCLRMPSSATHDANMMALKTDVGMLFVPSRDGLSHCREEWTDWSQCERGTEALYRTILKVGKEGFVC